VLSQVPPTDAVLYEKGERGEVHKLPWVERATPEGALGEVGSTGGRVLGLALDADGRLYA
jgi:hypothetical protein